METSLQVQVGKTEMADVHCYVPHGLAQRYLSTDILHDQHMATAAITGVGLLKNSPDVHSHMLHGTGICTYIWLFIYDIYGELNLVLNLANLSPPKKNGGLDLSFCQNLSQEKLLSALRILWL